MRWINTKRAGLWFPRIARWTSRKDRRFTCFCAYGGTTGALLRYAGNLCGVSRETNGGYGYRSSFELTPVGGFELATPSPEEENGPLVAYEDGSDLMLIYQRARLLPDDDVFMESKACCGDESAR